ncbi:MAG TPA: magnesium transporter [Chloroflexota bacterium]|nr:magnesium transporter [Chloroflexota bacterium]
MRTALAMRDAAVLRAWASQHPIALSQALSELDENETVVATELLGDELTADVVTELDPGEAAEVLERLDPADAADVLEEMAPDDAADVAEELDEAESVLGEMAHPEAAELRELMAYPPDTAGGLMTPEFVAVRPTLTIAEAVAEIRRVADEAETVYYVYVTDADRRLVGVLSLRDLLLGRSAQPVTAVMSPDVASVLVTDDQEKVARVFRERRYMALPVVDDQKRMLGIITIDDVSEVVEEETTEDIERLGGSQPLDEPYLRAGVLAIVRKRVVWLLLLFVAEAYTGTVLRYFEDELQAVVALAFFVPLLIGTGGNVGSQTVTTIIRSMGVGDVVWRDLGRVLFKEVRISFLLGAVMAVATLIRAEILGVGVQIGSVVAVSAAFIVLWAGLVAAALPLTLRRLGVDPAVVSAPMITTLVDGTGLFIYFEIARYLLHLR